MINETKHVILHFDNYSRSSSLGVGQVSVWVSCEDGSIKGVEVSLGHVSQKAVWLSMEMQALEVAVSVCPKQSEVSFDWQSQMSEEVFEQKGV